MKTTTKTTSRKPTANADAQQEMTTMQTTQTTTSSTSTSYTPAIINTLSGSPLQVAYREVVGEEPNAKAPVIALRRRVIAELKRQEAEASSARAAAEAAHAAAVEMVEAPAAEPAPEAPVAAEPVIEAPAAEPVAPAFSVDDAMRAASEAVKLGADPKVCSDAVAAFEAGEIDAAAVQQRIVDAIPVSSTSEHVDDEDHDHRKDSTRGTNEPGVEIEVCLCGAERRRGVTTTENGSAGWLGPWTTPEAPAPALRTGACERCGRTDVLLKDDGSLTLHDRPDGSACNLDVQIAPEPAAEPPAQPATPRDAIDLAIERARSLEPAAQKIFLDGYDKKTLLAMVERVTGAKTSGRLSPASAVARIQAALAPAAPASIDTTPAAPVTPAAASTEPSASDDAPATGDAPTANTDAPAATTTTRAPAAELPPVGTVLQNKNARTGEVRAECKVVEGGVEYRGKVYKSLSAAAIQASHDLGNTTKQTSGPKFWGLVAAPRATTTSAKPKALDLDKIDSAWTKYRERAEALVKEAGADDIERVRALLLAHAEAIFALATPPAATENAGGAQEAA